MLQTLKFFFTRVYTITSIVLFALSYGAIQAYAVYYPTDNITNPSCAPGDSGCYVSLLPDQTSNSGSLLFTNGTNPSWTSSSALSWDSVNGRLGVGTSVPTQALDVSGKISLNGSVVAYRPTTMTGTLIFGDGGNNLSHTAGAEGYYNTFVGISSGLVNTTGNQNTAIGMQSLFSNTTGTYNTASGLNSLSSNTTGSRNTATGMQSLFSNTTGEYNTANGMSSLFGNTTGTYNTAYGYLSGRYIANGESNQTSNNSLYLGYDTRALADGNTNEIVIGSGAIGIGSNTVTLGNSSIITTALKGNIGIGTTSPTYQMHLVGSSPNVVLDRYSSDTTPGVFRSNKARGTTSSPTNVLANDGLVFLRGAGYNAGLAAFSDTASISIKAGEDYTTSGNRGSYISFSTNPNNSIFTSSGGIERMRLSDLGNLGIGSYTKLSKLTVTAPADTSDIGGTTTSNASTTITGVGTLFTTSLGIGDRISLSSTPGTYATVTAIASDTSLTVDTALGNGTSQTINLKKSIFRVDDASNVTKFLIQDDGSTSINSIITNPFSFGGGSFLFEGKVSNQPGNIIAMGNNLGGSNPIGRFIFGHHYGSTYTRVADIVANRASADDAADLIISTKPTGGALTARINISSTGTLTFSSLTSCGGLQTNGSGTLSCTSDERLKDIQGNFTKGLEAIRNINPKAFSWKQDSNLYDNGVIYSGFIAQNIQSVLPEAVSMSSDGIHLQVSQLTLLAASINAIKELDIKVNQLSSLDTIDPLSLGSLIERFLGDAMNPVKNIFVKKIRVEEICVDEQNCLTKDDIKTLIQNLHSNQNSNPVPVVENIENNNQPEVIVDDTPIETSEDFSVVEN